MKKLFLFLSLLVMLPVYAKDYGVHGELWPIAEEDFLVYIQRKLKLMQANGEWEKIQGNFRKKVEAHILRPKANFLPEAVENRSFHFDPSFITPSDVRDLKGNILVKKGTVINPLERVKLRVVLVFFNADNEKQLQWAQKQLDQKHKLILTSGSIKETTEIFHEAVYFDLQGLLTKRFGIRALPALVRQDGLKLEIQEIAL